MSFEIAYEQKPHFLQVTVTGENSAGAIVGYLDAIREECIRRDCYRVLIIEDLSGPRLGVDDVFAIASEGANKGLGVFHAIAYVDEHMGEMAYFAETVAVNRGMPVKTFANVGEAEAWLLSLLEGAEEERHIFEGTMPASDEAAPES